jgi:hypothetical protein
MVPSFPSFASGKEAQEKLKPFAYQSFQEQMCVQQVRALAERLLVGKKSGIFEESLSVGSGFWAKRGQLWGELIAASPALT